MAKKKEIKWVFILVVAGLLALGGLQLFHLLRYYRDVDLAIGKDMRSFYIAEVAICFLSCAAVIFARKKPAVIGPMWLIAYAWGMMPLLESRANGGMSTLRIVMFGLLVGLIVLNALPLGDFLQWLLSCLIWFVATGVLVVTSIVALNGSGKADGALVLLGLGYVLAILTFLVEALPGTESIGAWGLLTGIGSAVAFLTAPLATHALTRGLDQDLFVAFYLPYALRAAVVVLLAIWVLGAASDARDSSGVSSHGFRYLINGGICLPGDVEEEFDEDYFDQVLKDSFAEEGDFSESPDKGDYVSPLEDYYESPDEGEDTHPRMYGDDDIHVVDDDGEE